MKTLALTTALTLAIAAPAFANDQLAASLGVDGSLYTTAELAELKSAVANEDRQRIAYIKTTAEERSDATVSTKSGISAGHAQMAASLGVDANDYTVAELVALKSGIADDTATATIDGAGYGAANLSTKSGVSAGQAQIAASLGVDASQYTLAELVDMRNAREGDRTND